MLAGRARLGCRLAFVDIPAVIAFPARRLATLEHRATFYVGEELAVAALVPRFDLRDLAERLSYLREALIVGGLGEVGVENAPLFFLALRRRSRLSLVGPVMPAGYVAVISAGPPSR